MTETTDQLNELIEWELPAIAAVLQNKPELPAFITYFAHSTAETGSEGTTGYSATPIPLPPIKDSWGPFSRAVSGGSQFAIFWSEAWAAQFDLKQIKDDEDYKKLGRGDIAVSELPEAKRFEILVAYGEAEGGATVYRSWRIRDRLVSEEIIDSIREEGKGRVEFRHAPLLAVNVEPAVDV